MDCYTIDSRTSKPARKIKYVAYRGEVSLEGDARVSIQEFVLGSNGSPADVLDPFSIGRRGRFSDSLGVGPFGSSPGIAYQYFQVSITGAFFSNVPVPIVSQQGTSNFNRIDFSNSSINGDLGFAGLHQCTKEELDSLDK